MISKEKTKRFMSYATKTVKGAAKKTVVAGKRFANFQIPSSINWIYGLGFKVGVFLMLKSFLVLRYQWTNLAVAGFLTILVQMILGIVMIVGGVIMQSESMYEDSSKLRRAAGKYGMMAALGSVVMIMKDLMNWSYFKNPNAANWFLNIWQSITKGAAEFGLSLLFCDADLLIAFCALLYVIADVYLFEVFDDKKSISGRFIKLIWKQTSTVDEIQKND